jgi:hypothetical protein
MSELKVTKKRPNDLLDFILKKFEIVSDYCLAKELKVLPPYLCKARKNNNISPKLILKIHDRFGMSIAEIKSFLKKE